MPVYSFGEESPLKFEISDKLAKNYNDAVDEYLKAQQRFNQKYGRRWDPKNEPIMLNWNKARQKAWNQFAKIYKKVLEAEGPFHTNDLMDDFLVKNSPAEVALGRAGTRGGYVLSGMAQIDVPGLSKWTRAVGAATLCGALYGLLRGR